MDTFYKLLLLLHVSAGFTSLSLFFVPMIAKKGGKIHNRAGWWYVYGMGTVVVTAALLSIILVSRGDWNEGLFLGFLSVLTSRPLLLGASISQFKDGVIPDWLDRTSKLLLITTFLLSIPLVAVGSGLITGRLNPLLLVFGILGLTSLPEVISLLRRKDTERHNWLREHIRGMLISSIAAFTAFFAFGGRRLFEEVLTGNLMLIPWFAPTVLGVLAIKYYRRKYKV